MVPGLLPRGGVDHGHLQRHDGCPPVLVTGSRGYRRPGRSSWTRPRVRDGAGTSESRAFSPWSLMTGDRSYGFAHRQEAVRRRQRRRSPMALAPNGSVLSRGQAARGFLDWYTVSFATSGAVRWEAVRDGGLNTTRSLATCGVGRRHHRRDGRGGPTFRVDSSGCHRWIWRERDVALGGVLENGDGAGYRPRQWGSLCIGRLRRANHMLARPAGGGFHSSAAA